MKGFKQGCILLVGLFLGYEDLEQVHRLIGRGETARLSTGGKKLYPRAQPLGSSSWWGNNEQGRGKMKYLGVDVNSLAAGDKAQGVHTLSPLFSQRSPEYVCLG